MTKEQSAARREFPRRLRALRLSRGVSAAALGECCGLSKNIIQRYEKGLRYPRMESLVKIAAYFDVSLDYLLGLEKNF